VAASCRGELKHLSRKKPFLFKSILDALVYLMPDSFLPPLYSISRAIFFFRFDITSHSYLFAFLKDLRFFKIPLADSV
jgi:hypothetical protein